MSPLPRATSKPFWFILHVGNERTAMLMAYPGARLLGLTKYGLDPIAVEDTDHYRLMREFWANPKSFIETMLEE